MSYKISDSVAMRMIQIFQEALLLGVDGADLMRQVRLVVDVNNADTLSLDPHYEAQVAEMHKKYLDDAQRLRGETAQQENDMFVINLS